jgi:hypothetical protein
VEVHQDGRCVVEVALTSQIEDIDGDFVLARVTEGQYEVIHVHGQD